MRRALLVAGLAAVSACTGSAVEEATQAVLSYPGHGTVNYTPPGGGDDPSGANLASAAGVMTGPTVKVYLIYYGNNWNLSTQGSLFQQFFDGLGGSPIFNVLTTYDNGMGGHIPGTLSYGGSFQILNYPQSKQLDGDGITNILLSSIAGVGSRTGTLPLDANGIYLIIPDNQVGGTSGFGTYCEGYCGYHPRHTVCAQYFPTVSGCSTVQTAVVMNPTYCHTSASPPTTGCDYFGGTPSGPNADLDPTGDVDSMANYFWHEIAEALSDWQFGYTITDPSGDKENADQCEPKSLRQDALSAFPVGAVQLDPSYAAANGAMANTRLGARDYLLQPMWQHADRGGCVRRLALNHPTVSATAVTGDFDGNGTSDVLLRNPDGSLQLWPVDNNGNAPLPTTMAPGGGAPSSRWQIYGVGNFDADAKADILWRDLDSNNLVIWFMNGLTITSTTTIGFSLAASQQVKAVGDFDGNGLADILIQDMNDNSARVWLNGKTATPLTISGLAKVTPGPALGDDMESLASGDFSGGDGGKAEVLWHDLASGGGNWLWTFGAIGAGNSTIVATPTSITLAGMDRFLGVADVDRDGIVDVIGATNGTGFGSLVWFKMPSGTAHPIPLSPPVQYRYSGAGLAVRSGGRLLGTELLWRNRQSGGLVRWILNSDGTINNNAPLTTVTPVWDVVAN